MTPQTTHTPNGAHKPLQEGQTNSTAPVSSALTDARLLEQEGQKVGDRYLLWMLGRFLLPYRWQIAAVLLLLLAVSGISLTLPLIIQQAVDGPIANGDTGGILPYALAYFGIIAIVFVLRLGYTYWLQTIGQNVLMTMRQTLFEHILRQDMRFYNHAPVGQLVSRLSSDIESLTELLSTSIVMVLSNFITLVGIVIVMFALNWRLALLALCTLPILIVASVYFRRRIRPIASRVHQLVAEYLAFLNEQFNGMLIVQLFKHQPVSRREFAQLNDAYRSAHMELRDIYTYYSAFLQIMTAVGLGIVLYGGGAGVLAGWATLGMLIAFIDYTRSSVEPILTLSEQFAQIQTAFSAGERIARMLRVEPDIRDPETPVKLKHFTPTVQFEHVDFSYVDGAPVLKDVTFFVEAGQKIAIVGATGAGKTSLASLLARFYDVKAGHVRVGGIDVRDLASDDLRQYVAVVPQNPYCFNGTIADNLRLFDPAVSDEQMREAAVVACAAPFIERLPDGYDYMLLPGGANLSQGQRQLLALARALIHSPNSVLVLDEATSSIDTETEALIQQGLANILAHRTSIIIAHRLSTVRDADRIIVLKHGVIIEDGSHDELLAHDGLYAQLYRRQFEEGDMETVLS
ncbi:MAG: ABC transporter ATP-binding protein [Chloroflexota bacterium]|nr:ABC transporter ATP-binding protein [Chloroflexota bacterium]